MTKKPFSKFRIFLIQFCAVLVIGLLSCSLSMAQKSDGVLGNGGTPFPPPGQQSGVGTNQAGILSLLNGGDPSFPNSPNQTPFSRVVLDPDGFVEPGPAPCRIDVDPNFPGLLLRDPGCIRFLNPLDPFGIPPFLYFGPSNDCGFGLVPQIPGIVERDLVGLRLLGGVDLTGENNGQRILFGPTDDCTIGLVPQIPGLALGDPQCIRFLNPLDPFGIPPFLYFGPSNDCGFGLVPQIPGIVERDLVGLRLLGGIDPNNGENNGRRLLFGDTDDCFIGVAPIPNGLCFSDVRFKFLNPDPLLGPVLDLPIGVRGQQEGVSLSSSSRGLTVSNIGSSGKDGVSVDFGGPDCRIQAVAPLFPDPGLRLYDVSGIRICNPIPNDPIPPILFGSGDLCRIEAGPVGGLRLYDVTGIRICNPVPTGPIPPLFFGDSGAAVHFQDTGSAANSYFEIFYDIDARVPQFANVRAASFVEASSKRWKTNIATIENPLQKIEALRGVSFDWDKDHGGKSSIGLIAEEVAEVVPELVAFDPDGKTANGINYSKLVGLLIEGTKAQQQQIDAHQKTFDALQAENANLKAQLEESRQVSERTDQLENEVQLLRQQLEVLVESLAAQK